MKKHIIWSAMIGLLIFTIDTVRAQSFTNTEVVNSVNDDGKYAVLAQISRHLTGAVNTGKELKKEYPNAQFVVGMAGKVVKELAENEDLREIVETAKKHGIRLVVCEFAMKRHGVRKSDYDAYVQTTPNIYRYMFGLQEMGFNLLSL